MLSRTHCPPSAITNCRPSTIYAKYLNNGEAVHLHHQHQALRPTPHLLMSHLQGCLGPGKALKERLIPTPNPSHDHRATPKLSCYSGCAKSKGARDHLQVCTPKNNRTLHTGPHRNTSHRCHVNCISKPNPQFTRRTEKPLTYPSGQHCLILEVCQPHIPPGPPGPVGHDHIGLKHSPDTKLSTVAKPSHLSQHLEHFIYNYMGRLCQVVGVVSDGKGK